MCQNLQRDQLVEQSKTQKECSGISHATTNATTFLKQVTIRVKVAVNKVVADTLSERDRILHLGPDSRHIASSVYFAFNQIRQTVTTTFRAEY